MTQLHNLSAILKGSDIYLRYYTSEEPKDLDFEYEYDDTYTPESDFEFNSYDYENAMKRWRDSMQEVKFKDLQIHHLSEIGFNVTMLASGIPLDSIKHRIDIVDGCEVPECVNPHPCKPVAIIKPEPSIKSVTNCPTCGAECDIAGDETHYYIPKSKGILSEKNTQEDQNDLWKEANKLYNTKNHTQDGRDLQMKHFEIKRRT